MNQPRSTNWCFSSLQGRAEQVGNLWHMNIIRKFIVFLKKKKKKKPQDNQICVFIHVKQKF